MNTLADDSRPARALDQEQAPCAQTCDKIVRAPWCGRAAAQLTELVVKHRVGQDLPFLRGILSPKRKFTGGDLPGTDAPPPLEPFPWDAAAGKGSEGEH